MSSSVTPPTLTITPSPPSTLKPAPPDSPKRKMSDQPQPYSPAPKNDSAPKRPQGDTDYSSVHKILTDHQAANPNARISPYLKVLERTNGNADEPPPPTPPRPNLSTSTNSSTPTPTPLSTSTSSSTLSPPAPSRPSGNSPRGSVNPNYTADDEVLDVESEWIEAQTPDGKVYYYDRVTRVTTWKIPPQIAAQKVRRQSTIGANPVSQKQTAAIGDEDDASAPPPPPFKQNDEKIEGVLHDPLKIDHFKQFLGNDSGNKEILFYMDVERFKSLCAGTTDGLELALEQLVLAQDIFINYIQKGAKLRLELPAKILKDLIKKFKDAARVKNAVPIKANLFDDAQKLVFAWIKDQQFPQFLRSIYYIQMYNAMANRGTYELPTEVCCCCFEIFIIYKKILITGFQNKKIHRFGICLNKVQMDLNKKVGFISRKRRESLFIRKDSQITLGLALGDLELFQFHLKK